MREILAELTSALDEHRPCVFCSVIETRGSTPQKAGAAMLVFPDGSQKGTLGGGCVEAEVRQRALRSLGTGQAELHTFCLDDNYGWDDGLICGGRMCILADPLARPAAADYYRHYRELVQSGQGCTEAVLLSTADDNRAAGDRYLFNDAGRCVAAVAERSGADAIAAALVPLAKRPRSYVQRGVAFLPILPRITLFIIGGGHVGAAVARLAAEVDFDIWVLDDRERYANSERFPTAQRLFVGDIGATLKELVRTAITPSTYCIIVTRGHAHDEEALYHLAPTPARYVGMIGSKRKIKLIFEDLIAKGISEATLSRVHAPLGLQIASQTVPEIAVSIVAELIAFRNGGETSDIRHQTSDRCCD
jgi:xanthine dehydrogenase accessory factor